MEIMANLRDKAYVDFAKLDGRAERLTCLTQSVVHEVFWLSEDVDAIRARPVRCMFLKLSDEPDSKAQEFKVLV